MTRSLGQDQGFGLRVLVTQPEEPKCIVVENGKAKTGHFTPMRVRRIVLHFYQEIACELHPHIIRRVIIMQAISVIPIRVSAFVPAGRRDYHVKVAKPNGKVAEVIGPTASMAGFDEEDEIDIGVAFHKGFKGAGVKTRFKLVFEGYPYAEERRQNE